MQVRTQQHTLKRPVSCTGVGVHSGRQVHLTLKPAPVNHGIKFARVDLPARPLIPAHFNHVVDTSNATVIGADGVIVSTIEHLMACLAGMAVDNALVELDSHEMPIMDGSAGPFADLIQEAGLEPQAGPRCYFTIKEPIELKENGKFVGIYPLSTFKLTYTIEYDHPLIQKQTRTFDGTPESFAKEIARARTYGFLHEYEYLKRYGLAGGCSLDNVVVVDESGIVNADGLRYEDEFVRHKILDCIGDLALLGMPVIGHIVMSKSGHAFNYAFLKKFFSCKDSWSTCTLHAPAIEAGSPPKSLAI
ncbi:MAG: UDP-3-O-acyl-N-acetylglucosamine deacetylase [Desulfobacterales bacterium]|jgi:UDP-3-O-[3-hydroxymyristoyl] N-acetylglucosamine deacetylase